MFICGKFVALFYCYDWSHWILRLGLVFKLELWLCFLIGLIFGPG